MDTREKIVALETAAQRLAAGEEWRVVIGLFDPLTGSNSSRLKEWSARGKRILAVVEPGDDSLLPVEARAILVAALRTVALVVISAADEARSVLRGEIVTDDARPEEFAAFIRARQRSAI